MPLVLLLVLISAGNATSATGNEIGDEQVEGDSMTATFELPQAAPEEVGMSGERLNAIRDVVQEFIDEGRIQYAVVGVARRGKVVYFEAQGVSDEKPVRKDAMFHMASSTKPILGVAAMMVIEEGLVSPFDPVEKYIPEFKGIQVAVLDEKADKKTSGKKGLEKEPEYRLVDAHRPVTIHDLLTHTSGVSGRALGRTREIQHEGDTLATWIPVVAEGPLNFQPGTRWGYGGGLDVVARVIEIVSGMPFNEFVQKRIFDPLDMKDTHWIVPKDKRRQGGHAHHLFLRFLGPRQHCPRLPAFRADAGQQGRAVRQSASQTGVGRDDVHQPGGRPLRQRRKGWRRHCFRLHGLHHGGSGVGELGPKRGGLRLGWCRRDRLLDGSQRGVGRSHHGSATHE
ncbi:MAG: beta-lactamase family protein, partial [Pseudomonadales bacterium]|nr:beta-lactamase family protein [Pseudomonadales bacterium]